MQTKNTYLLDTLKKTEDIFNQKRNEDQSLKEQFQKANLNLEAKLKETDNLNF